MEGREKYEKLINKIRSKQPILEGKEAFVDNVMDKVRESGIETNNRKIIDFIFGWADKIWIRRTLATVSFSLIAIFLFQQFMIIDRIADLESRMVGGTYDEFSNSQTQKGNTRSVMRMMFEVGMANDSIIIAEKDLIELIRSYRDLQDRYKKLENIIIEQKNLQGMPQDKNLDNIKKTSIKIKT